MAHFTPLTINDNPDGWGPPLDLPPERFRDIPYAPFSKSDRLGRAADWTQYGRFGPDGTPTLDGDDAAFTLVDHARTPARSSYRFARGGGQFGYAASRGDRRGPREFNRPWSDLRRRDEAGRPPPTRGSRGPFYGRSRYDDRRNQRQSSIEIHPGWDLLQETTFSDLSKMTYSGNLDHELLVTAGSLRFYDKSFDRVTTRVPKKLTINQQCAFHNVTTTDDLIIRRLASSRAGNVFITSPIACLLMTAARSSYSWDVIVQRVGNTLFFDRRDSGQLDLLTVNETAFDQPRDEKSQGTHGSIDSLNTAQALALEATLVNQNFSQAVLRNGPGANMHQFAEPYPFELDDGEEAASVGYLYKRWNIVGGLSVVVRTEVDAALDAGKPGEPARTIIIKALNEVPDSAKHGDWRSRLDGQRGAVLANELKNNSAKLARWTAQSLLAGADQLKLGFVSREMPRTNTQHVILGTQTSRPRDFADQIALNIGNMWAVLKHFADLGFKHLPEAGGKAIIVKDPNQPMVRLYRVPDDAFEDMDDEADTADDGRGAGEEEDVEGTRD
uniref:EIF3d n=1 Tax=Compsopogon caeruleus TaxID=31354 RepID=A0A7S1X9U9_9RHOD|mmetsp:Transcript_10654/g.21455  ORF Transcript_10654/g.21455 Transcript_10654/m.21455 type:complete len:556 (+) Transcript_10654:57-1724(+)